jgi:DNA-binding LytR/AlgR family response regulator
MMPSAIVADDEPRLAQDLAARLQKLWPQLDIIAAVNDGVAAASLIAERQPTFAFLDIRMPGIDGIGVARVARDTRIVFVTAYDEYAVAAFDAAAADYLLKPVSDARLAHCVARLREQSTRTLDVNVLTSLLSQRAARGTLEWLTIRLGDTTRLVSVEEVLYFQSGDKYTEVVTAAERHLIRTALKGLLEQLDPNHFAQIHRSIVVNLRAVEFIERDILGRSRVHLRGRADTLPLSRSFVDRFRQM